MFEQTVTRRSFSRLLAGAGLTSTLALGEEPDQPTTTSDQNVVPGAAGPATPAEAPEEALAAPEELLLAALVQLHPSGRLTPERIDGIRRELRQNLARGAALRRTPLLNSDGPATTFRAFRAPEEAGAGAERAAR